MTDQISFLPMLEPSDTSFDDNECKASQICDEEFERADGIHEDGTIVINEWRPKGGWLKHYRVLRTDAL